jgi:hypothetical protein
MRVRPPPPAFCSGLDPSDARTRTHTTKNTFGLWIVDEGEAEGVYTDRREDGVGLFLHASYFNHSCTYAPPSAPSPISPSKTDARPSSCPSSCAARGPKTQRGPMQQARRQARRLHRLRRHQARYSSTHTHTHTHGLMHALTHTRTHHKRMCGHVQESNCSSSTWTLGRRSTNDARSSPSATASSAPAPSAPPRLVLRRSHDPFVSSSVSSLVRFLF